MAVATTAIIGGVQAATASPADDALQVLTADERTIAGAEAALASMRQQVAAEVAEADARAEALSSALPGAATAADPADIAPGETEAPDDADRINIVDPVALERVSTTIEAYRAELKAITLPALPAPYEHSEVDEDSLVDVGSAIDRAQQQLTDVDRAMAALRDVREQMREREAAHVAQLRTFTSTFRAAAEKAIADHPDASPKLKDAVTAAADAVVAADLRADAGIKMLAQYRDAVFALASAQVNFDRVREEERQRQERERLERESRPQRPLIPEPSPTRPPPEEPTPNEPEPTQPPDESDDGETGVESATG